MFRSKLLLVLVTLALSACSVFQKESKLDKAMKGPRPVPDKQIMEQFNLGSKLLGQEKYQRAYSVFENILVERPTSQFELIVLYNTAAAQEGMGKCRKAARKYRTVSRRTGSKHKRLQAQSLLRLSYMYDCLGMNHKVISSLLDVRLRKKFLPAEISMAEVPARLAAAYARQGNLSQAEKFFAEAEAGLAVINKSARNTAKQQAMIAQTLFVMGRMDTTLVNLHIGASYMRSLRFLQPYLLRAVEMNLLPWSKQASRQIVTAYESVWSIVRRSAPKKGGKDFERIQKVQMQRKTVEMSLESLAALKALRFPETRQSRLVGDLFDSLAKEEKKMTTFLAKSSQVTPLTPEAEKRQAIRRRGRVKSGKTILESEFEKKKKKGGK